MRTTILCAIALAAFGCAAKPSSNMARAPRVDLPTSTTVTPPREAMTGPMYDSQKGFEEALPPPNAVGGGPMSGTDSDMGEPRWRNNPGSYDDGTRREVRPRPGQSWLERSDEHMLPPDKFR